MDKYLGKRLDGRYEMRELIGVGGMAYVYYFERCPQPIRNQSRSCTLSLFYVQKYAVIREEISYISTEWRIRLHCIHGKFVYSGVKMGSAE